MSFPTPTTFVFEAIQNCSHDCGHCYNVWNLPQDYPQGRLSTEDTLAMLGKLYDETGARHLTISGGEPLLRQDLFDIMDGLRGRNLSINLISNGYLVDEAAIERLTAGPLGFLELPLLSCVREIHDAMSGREGAFDKVTMAMALAKQAGLRVVAVFVATKVNLHTFRDTAELALALGADALMFNRFNPGGTGAQNVAELQASPSQLVEAMHIAEELAVQHRIPVSCSIAMPPCLFDTKAFPHLGFGFCAAGSERAYYAVDPLGNIRPCNHSAIVLGNIREQSYVEIMTNPAMDDFVVARPSFCKGCSIEDTCMGGCKAAAEVCVGSPWEMDPFLAAYQGEAVKLTGAP